MYYKRNKWCRNATFNCSRMRYRKFGKFSKLITRPWWLYVSSCPTALGPWTTWKPRRTTSDTTAFCSNKLRLITTIPYWIWDTLWVKNEARSVNNQVNINQLNGEFRNLRHLLEEDRASLRQLQNIFALDKKSASDGGKTTNPHSNKIPAVPNFDPTSIPVDSSGVDPGRVDQVSSSLEEERNTIGHSLEELMIHKDRTQEQMEHIKQKFFQHDAEFSRFYTMFYNLSLQVSNLENKLLVHQKSQFDAELAEMQRCSWTSLNKCSIWNSGAIMPGRILIHRVRIR